AAQFVRRILRDPQIDVLPQSSASFQAGLELYEQRLDKGYSLVDCISMVSMRNRGGGGGPDPRPPLRPRGRPPPDVEVPVPGPTACPILRNHCAVSIMRILTGRHVHPFHASRPLRSPAREAAAAAEGR